MRNGEDTRATAAATEATVVCIRGGPSAGDKDGEGEIRRESTFPQEWRGYTDGTWEWPRSRRLRQWDAGGVISVHIVTLLTIVHRRKSQLCALPSTEVPHTYGRDRRGNDEREKDEDLAEASARARERERDLLSAIQIPE